ncbi:hypothetical protein [Mycobacterium sp. 236(2023)]|uniref:hypothetical protein n=1 Tax=Mycobacterium sp. 236(2023) TaxID=3038163 RepID=UPI002414E9C7|nr:hypothetical protein [Mycobacterium sp. 236(2023)]MDG4666166.1 hypothetical protein [Mycobacterium sp. 236(2023)]
MPSHFSDRIRFGPASFIACAVNMMVLELITWFLMPMWVFVPFIVGPIVAVNAAIAYGLTKIGSVAQIGRGMLISCIAAPLSIALAFGAIVNFQG